MKRMGLQRLIHLARKERGSTLVEFAMTSLIFMGIVVSVLEFALAVYTYHFVSTAAQLGSRFAVVRGNTWGTGCSTSAPPSFKMVFNCTASGTDIQNYVQSLATGGISASKVTVDTTSADMWPGTNPDGASCLTSTNLSNYGQGCLVKVKVSYTFNFFKNVYPLQKLPALSMSATSQGVILQ